MEEDHPLDSPRATVVSGAPLAAAEHPLNSFAEDTAGATAARDSTATTLSTLGSEANGKALHDEEIWLVPRWAVVRPCADGEWSRTSNVELALERGKRCKG
jgi:hypothetical protein